MVITGESPAQSIRVAHRPVFIQSDILWSYFPGHINLRSQGLSSDILWYLNKAFYYAPPVTYLYI